MTRHLENAVNSNVDISSATLLAAYTADADRSILCQFFIDQVAGNDDYTFYLTLQIGGAGSAYRIEPITTASVAAGVTAIAGQSAIVNVRNTDVLSAYVVGAAGDTVTPDILVRWFEVAALRPITADRDLLVDASGKTTLSADSLTSSVYDESTAFPIKSTDSGATQIARVGADGDTLETLSDQIDSIGGGAGAISWTVTVDDGANPLDGVEVWVTTDLAGLNIVASGTTDALGEVDFMLDAGDYYFWKQLSGYNFTNPEADTVV